jgi:hypothetical protein
MARPFRFADRFRPTAMVADSRYLIVPCEAEGCGDLAVIWDRLEEQVVDVISAAASARYSDEDMLWDEGREAFAAGPALADDWRIAA